MYINTVRRMISGDVLKHRKMRAFDITPTYLPRPIAGSNAPHAGRSRLQGDRPKPDVGGFQEALAYSV